MSQVSQPIGEVIGAIGQGCAAYKPFSLTRLREVPTDNPKHVSRMPKVVRVRRQWGDTVFDCFRDVGGLLVPAEQ